MQMQMRHSWSLVVTSAVILAAGLGCCCSRKGIVLRGDWSLELNRVKHLSTNGPKYDADCCEAADCEADCGEANCGGPCQCTDGCTTDGCVSGCRCGAHAGTGEQAAWSDAGGGRVVGYGPEFLAGRRGGFGPGGGYAGGDGAQMPPPPMPTPAGPARFHPVPTRPVFEPQVETYGPAPTTQWVPSARAKSLSER